MVGSRNSVQHPSGPWQASTQLARFDQEHVMGKDPYPENPVGIPFCKPEWEELQKDQCSGHHVLLSLGADLRTASIDFRVPEDYFCYLAEEKGVAFLNLSYHSLHGPCRKRAHYPQLSAASEVNSPVLSKSTHVVFCGEAKKYLWYGNTLPNSYFVVHPDVRCRISRYPNVAKEWQAWWSRNAIARRFEFDV